MIKRLFFLVSISKNGWSTMPKSVKHCELFLVPALTPNTFFLDIMPLSWLIVSLLISFLNIYLYWPIFVPSLPWGVYIQFLPDLEKWQCILKILVHLRIGLRSAHMQWTIGWEKLFVFLNSIRLPFSNVGFLSLSTGLSHMYLGSVLDLT